MLRGFRWQALALVISVVLFGVVVSFRFLGGEATPDTIAEATSESASPTPSPAPTLTPAPTFTPQPTTVDSVAVPEDTITTFTEGVVGSVQRLNPLLISSQVERDITSLIFQGLVGINEFGEPEPELASDWAFSRDGYEMVVLLRQDILWQDGTPFDVEDVLYTYSLLASPDFPVPEVRAFWQTVEIQRLGNFALRFRLAQPLASFPTRLTMGILPQHALVGTTASGLLEHPFNLTPIGTGAYQLETLRSVNGQQIDGLDLRVAPTFRQ
ncbi:MAG: ABC transporter substrate-binding protein, partial [Chloroflexota bacterium]